MLLLAYVRRETKRETDNLANQANGVVNTTDSVAIPTYYTSNATRRLHTSTSPSAIIAHTTRTRCGFLVLPHDTTARLQRTAI
jgi:hypothetical protein